jgi:lysophospholipase L1-like esterase
MVTIGEALTAGGDATSRALCWASVLAELISQFQHEPIELINAGMGANVVSARSAGHEPERGPSALERYHRGVSAHHPDLVVVAYGLNDMRTGTPLDRFAADIVELLVGIKRETQAVIVLVNVYFMTGYARFGPRWDKGGLDATVLYNAALHRIAEQQQVLLADVFGAMGMAPWLIDDSNGVHANDLGHRLIAHRIFEVLATNCSGLAQKAIERANDYPRWRDETALAVHPR